MGEAQPRELAERLIDFAVRMGRVVDALPRSRLGQHVAGQLVRSGTSPAPNYAEGCAAESRRDVIHKLSISLKGVARNVDLAAYHPESRASSIGAFGRSAR
jgi:hypothetical protein